MSNKFNLLLKIYRNKSYEIDLAAVSHNYTRLQFIIGANEL